MNHGSIGTDRGAGSNLLGQAGSNSAAAAAIYQQPNMHFNSPSSSLGVQLGDISSNLGRMSIEVNNNLFGSIPQEKDNLTAKYRVSWNKASNAFTITLLIPKRRQSSDTLDSTSKSPFKIVEDGNESNPNKQTHYLRIPISYLVNMSNQTSSAQKQQSAPWLDRTTLRGRLSDGGKALGFNPSHVAQTIAAVEESATRLTSWSPPNADTINVDVELSDGVVSMVAHIGADSVLLPQSPHPQSSVPTSQSDFSYSHLSDTSISLHASGLSLTGESALSASFSGQQANTFSNFEPSSSSNSHVFGNTFGASPVSGSDLFGQPKGSLSLFDPWHSNNPNGVGSGREFLPNNLYNQNLNDGVDNLIQRGASFGSTSSPLGSNSVHPNNAPVSANQLFSSPTSDLRRMSSVGSSQGVKSRPDPSIIVEPLLSLGFNLMECEAAVTAIRNLSVAERSVSEEERRFRSQSSESSTASNHQISLPQQTPSSSRHQRQVSAESILGYVLNNGGSNMSLFEHRSGNTVGTDMNSGEFHHRDSQSAASISSHSDQMSTMDDLQTGANASDQASDSPVWGNAGKLMAVKSSSSINKRLNVDSSADINNRTDQATNTTIGNTVEPESIASSQKVIKVLDIPPDLNAFVFHCNAHTREECLQRQLFGCPSGGQYGPHSKAKKGDLLFLADFSAWTVTGIFTAQTDAGLNIDKSAWSGRFPWQIKVNPWDDLRTVHIDKVNEIIGLASGSKLNMLTKDQLVQLVMSKEFGPCVPAHLFKVKRVTDSPLTTTPSTNKSIRLQGTDQPIVRSNDEGNSVVGTHGIKYARNSSALSTTDEHPATAMHRLKLIASWFDSLASQILLMNELYNDEKPSSRKENKEKTVLDQDVLGAIGSCKGEPWPLMTYTYIRDAVADVFDQWLMYSHACTSKIGTSDEDVLKIPSTGSWTKQQSRVTAASGKTKEDVVLITNIPGSKTFVSNLFQSSSGVSAMSVPKPLAEVLSTKFLSEVEQISLEVRKTQLFLMKIGGEHYMKSIEDKSLGMKVSVSEAQEQLGSNEIPGRKMMKIEWHTKSSIAQGRPPQVQKIYKTHFDVLQRSYKNQAMTEDPELCHFLTRLFVLLCRHDLIGDIKHRCQAILPLPVQKIITTHFGVAHECFASPLSNFKSYFNATLFADASSFFGSLGHFSHFLPIEGSYLVNPPIMEKGLKPTLDHIYYALENSSSNSAPLSFLVVLRGSNSILNSVQKSPFCRRIETFDNIPKYSINTSHKDTLSATRKQTKGNDDVCHVVDCSGAWTSSFCNVFIWLQNDKGYDVWQPSDDRVALLSHSFTEVA
mmetsp:Transcript_1047/g.1864  ORF Transcript_1047/g.1864 Transcript_1047/m.1864 type:complete len:1315 (+) Transcript_1047:133-4077(+)|eukprot:CAMPEP_0176499288 /NCGR_PEP_ID=MMETSP0200_2-20121128/12846_1 /TAXON_ID=947934 /ORGANISM="Chaetoceros sp., Strain GSL56" /LENGTH=1314 /DNA_ID=CAMNT_0017897695 /DNA_START=188 /DNA_END=4132 /DNA_ORIENTATION=+